MEIQAVAGSLGPPGGAGVYSILWAKGETPRGQVPVWTSYRKGSDALLSTHSALGFL